MWLNYVCISLRSAIVMTFRSSFVHYIYFFRAYFWCVSVQALPHHSDYTPEYVMKVNFQHEFVQYSFEANSRRNSLLICTVHKLTRNQIFYILVAMLLYTRIRSLTHSSHLSYEFTEWPNCINWAPRVGKMRRYLFEKSYSVVRYLFFPALFERNKSNGR